MFESMESTFALGLHGLAPGAEMAALLESTDQSTLSRHDRVDYIAATDRLVSWAQGLQLAAVGDFAGLRPDTQLWAPTGPGDRLPAGEVNPSLYLEVAAALRISDHGAGDRCALARSMHDLPAVLTALQAGSIDLAKARAITDVLAPLEAVAATAAADRVLTRAGDQTLGQLKASLRRIVFAADPAGAQDRHDTALDKRRVILTPAADGMGEIWASLPADEASAVYTALTALGDAAKAPGDARTLDQRRADALADLARTVLDTHELPVRQRRRPHLHLTLAASTALGLDEQPGELAGYGPIPAQMARRIAGDATWRRILTDPLSGTLLDYGTTTYAPPKPLADFVLTRDATCRAPGCRQPAHRCDLDSENARAPARAWPDSDLD